MADEKALLTKSKGQIAHKIVICSSEKVKIKPLKNLTNHIKKDEQIVNGFNWI